MLAQHWYLAHARTVPLRCTVVYRGNADSGTSVGASLVATREFVQAKKSVVARRSDDDTVSYKGSIYCSQGLLNRTDVYSPLIHAIIQ